ncbi:MAG: hypothetical protein KF760_08415 [Candidatus Eremiobacteraeota bacterium]|nr:hypothetical protein [Candidatus Eremiobacteraeota bacterium]MCW5870896.1 hypothetical protein [Candidatus Eremiobacteraeota bacterium]
MDAYDISGVSDPLEGLPQDAPAPAESPEAEGGAAPMVEENGFTPQATDIPGEMWFFSAGSGCVDGGASDWGGLAGLD